MGRRDYSGFLKSVIYTEAWERLGLDSDDLLVLQESILDDPKRYPVVPGTGRLRKIRFAPPSWNVGKSGAIRT